MEEPKPLQLEKDLRSAAAALSDRLPTKLGPYSSGDAAPVSYLASKLVDALAGDDNASPGASPKPFKEDEPMQDVSNLPALPETSAAPVLTSACQ